MSAPALSCCSPRQYVLPDRYTIEFAPNGGVLAPPKGLLTVELIEAQHVPRVDFFSKTDPRIE